MKTKVRKSELAGNDPSDPLALSSGISALYDNCDRIQAADRDVTNSKARILSLPEKFSLPISRKLWR